ncbi:hypothetical protein [Sphingobacterium sp. SGR-19]|uniref:hypothetical protein n=1 Tax=Sphingobacterium sp. SGR-19 TaxID=2710886 RepID=UPI0013EBC212|nr:hypothetical protein [Sphingobacterium sp. SGR-19]NGM64591.1 hypothetical protein [Sphingobacterium sp. SGR-19]
MSNISFGQRIEWWVGSSPYVTYYDDYTLIFDTGDGILSGQYELLSDGRTITYEVTVNPPTGAEVTEFYTYALYDMPNAGPNWWDIWNQPHTIPGPKTYSGSFYLSDTEPVYFFLSNGYNTIDVSHYFYFSGEYQPN